MNKTYYRKENVHLWYLIIFLGIALLVFGYTLVRYFAWQVLPIIAIGVGKLISLSKNPEVATISLNDEGITLLNNSEDPPFYEYANISAIKIDSKAFNGHLRLKNPKKKKCYQFGST